MSKFLKSGSLVLALTLLCQFFITTPIRAEGSLGDLNGDGLVNAIDYAHLRGYLLKMSTPSGTDWEKNADMYKDGNVNSLDFAVFRQYILGMIKELPFVPGQVGNTPVPPTPTPQGDWVKFIPQANAVGCNLVIESLPQNDFKEQKYIQVTITFNNGGYRIVDEGKLEASTSESGEVNFSTSGVQIEKYVGPNPVTEALVSRQIKYPIEDELGSKNFFDFKVYDTSVTGFAFTKNSVIAPSPVPYGASLNNDFVNANTQFAANLFKKFNEDDLERNVFFSPFSISMALSMVYQGADSTTQEAMAKVLNYSEISTEEINKSYMDHLSYFKKLYPQVELNVANSIWISDAFKVNESFINKNKEVFDAESSYLDFSKPEACDIMNKWISEATKGKIDKMLNPPIDPSMIMYLMNAIYFKGSWTDQFAKSQTKDLTFTNAKGEEKIVPMMNKTHMFPYAETSEYRAVALPYGSGSVSMYAILPETENINDFVAEFDNNKWKEIKSKLKSTKIKLTIPRFKIEYTPKEIPEKLKELGMEAAFLEGADFSGIAEDVWIDDVIHKAVIEVNEEGMEAAAVTIIGMATVSIPKEPDSFIADKPFMFVVADNATGTVLFMGKVADIED